MVTFVTAFLDLGEDRSKDKSVDTCFLHFSKLVESGISIVAFVSSVYLERITPSPNLHVLPLELHELETYKESVREPCALPESRTDYHDTLHFMILMNAKIEFVHRAIEHNPFQSSHFAWIDFSIFHVFRNPHGSRQFLRVLSESALSSPCLTFPGCWEKDQGADSLFKGINWRFCGGFFLGDIHSLRDFYTRYRSFFPQCLSQTKTMVWEVNMWHAMELDGWSCEWYRANHDDSILRIPRHFFTTVASMTTIPSRIHTCRHSIDSLLPQVDHIYLSVARFYNRFQQSATIPAFFSEEPYASNVTIVLCDDKGPATKYLGALDILPKSSWIFFCDDDQEYAPHLVQSMRAQIHELAVYQNRYCAIQETTSGGLIHGYVGNLGHASLFQTLPSFPLPECAFHVDDQWLSIFCFLQGIPIYPTGIERYSDIFQRLEDGHECIGIDSLASLGTRDQRVSQLADFFQVQFVSNGMISKK